MRRIDLNEILAICFKLSSGITSGLTGPERKSVCTKNAGLRAPVQPFVIWRCHTVVDVLNYGFHRLSDYMNRISYKPLAVFTNKNRLIIVTTCKVDKHPQSLGRLPPEFTEVVITKFTTGFGTQFLLE